RRRCKRSRYPDITIGARGERIVSCKKHALSSHLQIENRFGQFCEGDSTAHCKRPTGQIACEPIEGERIVPESDSHVETSQRGKSCVRETGDIHRHVPCSAQSRITKCSAHVNVQSEVAIQLLEVRNELTNKIYRASRQPSPGGDRGVIGNSSSPCNFRDVERHAGRYFQWLNPRLLQLS